MKHLPLSLTMGLLASSMLSSAALAQVSIYGAHAEESVKRQHAVGITARMQTMKDSFAQSDFYGYGIVGSTTVLGGEDRDIFLRGSYTVLQSDNDFDPEGDSIEAALVWGSNLRANGFKWYLGGGYFRESWDFPYLVQNEDGSYSTADESTSASSWLVTAGTGYNWKRIGIDVWVTYKNDSQYEEPWQELSAVGSISTSITYRF
jgi:hypothetical protein